MNRIQILFPALALSFMTLAGSFSQAAATLFNDRATWQAAAGESQTIDFSTDDAGNPLSDPPADVAFPSLTIKGVTFNNINSFNNTFIYAPRFNVLHVDLPADTTAFGVDISPYDTAGTFTIKLSTGEDITQGTTANPAAPDFFGVTSSTPIQWVEFRLDSSYLVMDNFSFVVNSVQPISIDVVPGSTINPVNPHEEKVKVAILSTASFDARTVAPQSVRFGVNGTEAAAKRYTFRDVNHDGLKDMLLLFRTRDTQIPCGATEVKLTAQTTAGQKLSGTDHIKTVGCH